jgi:hypothetical protein
MILRGALGFLAAGFFFFWLVEAFTEVLAWKAL